MKSRVTIDLELYERMEAQIKELRIMIERVDRELKLVHNTSRDALHERACLIECSQNRSALHSALSRG